MLFYTQWAIKFFCLTWSFQPHYFPIVVSAFNTHESQKMFLGSRVCPAHKAYNLTVICELIV
jgi:hypothetical protein